MVQIFSTARPDVREKLDGKPTLENLAPVRGEAARSFAMIVK
jgi:hypothetical protein